MPKHDRRQHPLVRVRRHAASHPVLLGCGAGVLRGLPAHAIWADAAGDSAQPVALEEIIVTANKRSELLQEIPTSIRAFSGEELERLGANAIEDYAAVTPGLQLTGVRNSTQVNMRGVTTGPVNHDQSEIAETVGIYLDETPIAVQRFNPNLKLYDLERVEVLRGPQGTLYGAGSMAGAVRMITRKPDPSVFDASTSLSTNMVADGGMGYSFDGMVNVPLGDTLALRAVGFYRHDAGYIDNEYTGKKDVNDLDASGGRVAMRWNASDALSFDAMVSYQDQKTGAAAYYAPEVGDLKSIIDGREPSHDKTTILSLTSTYQMGFADLTVALSHLKKDFTYELDDGTFTNFVTGTRDGLGGVMVNHANQDDTNLEVRLSSNADHKLEWTVGVFYQKAKNDYGQDFTVPGVDAVAGFDSTDFGANPDQLYYSAIKHDDKQLALFGEVGIPITTALKLTIGGRYFDSTQDSTIDFRGIFAYPAIGVEKFHATEDGFNPKVNLSYQIGADHVIYAQAAKGFRLGGTNEPVPLPYCQASLDAVGLTNPPESYKSDSLWNYEIGAKTQWLDRRLTINGAIYKIKWNDPQVTAQLPCGFNIFMNAGGLDIYGGELEVAAQITRDLTARVNYGYVDSSLSEDMPFLNAHEGDTAPYTPKDTFSAVFDYQHPIRDGLDLLGALVYSYRSSINTKFNPNASQAFELGGFSTLNAKAGVAWEKWSVELYGDNLTNERGELNRFNNPFHLNPATDLTVIEPRTIGVRLDYKF